MKAPDSRPFAGIPHCFVTNNPIRTQEGIQRHFAALGLPVPNADQIVTSALATAVWLDERCPGFRYFAVGARGLHDALSRVGVEDPVNADFVVVGEGEGIDFEALTVGINLILQGGAELVCTNPDDNVDETVDGRHRVLPGDGALVAPFAVATGREPVFIGKPHPLLYRMASRQMGLAPEDCVMVGDRPDTDIAGAAALGMRTALVRSGRFARGLPLDAGVLPDWDCDDLPALLSTWCLSGCDEA